MTDTEINIAIATALGWRGFYERLDRDPDSERLSFLAGFPPGVEVVEKHYVRDWKSAPVPNYVSDLNAMHEAELRFHAKFAEATEYFLHLESIVGAVKHSGTGLGFQVINASARQRSEAFLRTINLWKE